MEPFHLQRFLDAHLRDFPAALAEIKGGRKLSHWMWYIFPQIAGLGRTEISSYYAISSLEEAKAYMEEHSKKEYKIYEADADAEYDEVVEIDLAQVRPTVAFPHLPGNAKTIDEIEAMEPIWINQVVIGSCTNGRMEDMRKAAAILKGRTVHQDVRVMVIPATQKIYKQCIAEGLVDIFIDAGCAVNTPSCGPCMGGHMGVMAAGEKCVSTTNRNFVGRMGHVDSLIYLASPEVAAASAIAGCIANPEKVGDR